ncbi:NAD(P)/FAD-dependent oxidoreductase [Megasphaera cerevisiae]|uniref:NAD(P)/FAD-dependent oxidoreductase n=1 Tax=Megasphaera cerevisiae TaxID=39029 RepID=UPI00094452FC|nr:NAD(P)/FAD-dependent oxidoreductase [Megasphaera cerevisiae]OKY53755.1 FAD/NAD(P)-binding oxidoreductase [Megasphaera cerevisiae]
MTKQADVVVIGGGITGTAILHELAKYNLRAILVEREPELAAGTTKANSAILHAGFDAPEGSMKARMNVEGNKMYHDLKDELNLEIRWSGSLVAAVDDEQMAVLKDLLKRGKDNDVPGLEIWDGNTVRESEPNVSKDVKGALWAPTAGICWPFGLALAFAENAVINGAEILRECTVTGITVKNHSVTAVETNQGTIETKYVINAAGIHADEISRLAGDDSFYIHPRKGEYILFDKTAQKDLVYCPVFPTPTKMGKGILVCATTHGNVFVGPNAQDMSDDEKENTAVTIPGMDETLEKARRLVPNIPVGATITEFAGVRAVSSTGDFVLGPSAITRGLIQAAGIQSPGLTSAPAIAKYLVDGIASEMSAARKADYKKGRPAQPCFRMLTNADQKALIAKDARYGRVICRCETITEGEILDAIHRPVGARTVDGVKRRTRAGMGRCQGGFCGPRVTQILARELNIPITEVRKEMSKSYMFYDKETQSGGKA